MAMHCSILFPSPLPPSSPLTKRLKWAQNCAARLGTPTRQREHITSICCTVLTSCVYFRPLTIQGPIFQASKLTLKTGSKPLLPVILLGSKYNFLAENSMDVFNCNTFAIQSRCGCYFAIFMYIKTTLIKCNTNCINCLKFVCMAYIGIKLLFVSFIIHNIMCK